NKSLSNRKQQSLIALFGDEVKRFLERELLGERQVEGNEEFRVPCSAFHAQHLLPYPLRRILAHGPAALTAIKLRDVRPEHSHVVANLRHRADGRARRFDGVALVDGDGGLNDIDIVHLRFVHTIEELAGVRRESLDVPALPLGEKSVEGERAFTRAAQSRDDNQPVERKIEIE